MVSIEDVSKVSPALENFSQTILPTLWRRQGLSSRDRSIVTLAALVTRGVSIEMPDYIALALDNGVKPSEVSELMTHLAFYAGWSNAMLAVPAAKAVFEQRRIDLSQLPAADVARLPLNEAAEELRATRVSEQFEKTAPGLVQNTTDVLFNDLWLRPALAPRDRSLVTVCALVTAGQVAQIPYHLNRAMDNGLTAEEAGETLTHLAFYAGWPAAFTALPVVKDAIEKRRK